MLKGKDEKVLQGWLPGLAPFGYVNSDDRAEPIKPKPEKSKTVARVFELYARGDQTFESLGRKLAAEGHTYSVTSPPFTRTRLSYIQHNRFYLGEIIWHGKTYPGKHVPLIAPDLFRACQDVLHPKAHHKPDGAGTPMGGGLFRCAHCGQSITGELIRKKLRDGSVRQHLYYRCANNHPTEDHPIVRWKAEDLDQAIIQELDAMRLPSPETRDWFRNSLLAAFGNIEEALKRQRLTLTKRRTELKGMQDRLLNAYLAGTIDEAVFQAKSGELKTDMADADRSLDTAQGFDPEVGQQAVQLFDWTQRAGEVWLGSNIEQRRRILDSVCLNRTLSDADLCIQRRRPFDLLAERPSVQSNRGDRI